MILTCWGSIDVTIGAGGVCGWVGGGGGWAMCHALGILMHVLFVWGGCGEVGGASGEECCKQLLEEGGYLWCAW